MTEEHLALQAEQLLKNDVLLEAIRRARVEAIEKLVEAAPDDCYVICQHQADIKALDSLTENLQRFIIAQQD